MYRDDEPPDEDYPEFCIVCKRDLEEQYVTASDDELDALETLHERGVCSAVCMPLALEAYLKEAEAEAAMDAEIEASARAWKESKETQETFRCASSYCPQPPLADSAFCGAQHESDYYFMSDYMYDMTREGAIMTLVQRHSDVLEKMVDEAICDGMPNRWCGKTQFANRNNGVVDGDSFIRVIIQNRLNGQVNVIDLCPECLANFQKIHDGTRK